jgi:hypothetical protein
MQDQIMRLALEIDHRLDHLPKSNDDRSNEQGLVLPPMVVFVGKVAST